METQRISFKKLKKVETFMKLLDVDKIKSLNYQFFLGFPHLSPTLSCGSIGGTYDKFMLQLEKQFELQKPENIDFVGEFDLTIEKVPQYELKTTHLGDYAAENFLKNLLQTFPHEIKNDLVSFNMSFGEDEPSGKPMLYKDFLKYFENNKSPTFINIFIYRQKSTESMPADELQRSIKRLLETHNATHKFLCTVEKTRAYLRTHKDICDREDVKFLFYYGNYRALGPDGCFPISNYATVCNDLDHLIEEEKKYRIDHPEYETTIEHKDIMRTCVLRIFCPKDRQPKLSDIYRGHIEYMDPRFIESWLERMRKYNDTEITFYDLNKKILEKLDPNVYRTLVTCENVRSRLNLDLGMINSKCPFYFIQGICADQNKNIIDLFEQAYKDLSN